MIPSYDDLTPGIPDVSETRLDAQIALFLREDLQKRSEDQAQKTAKPPELLNVCVFACLRAAGQVPALLAIARDFSPRVMRASDCEVLLDVSGLGRLIGPPPEIARQLARASYDAGLQASVALAPTQTTARLLATQAPDFPLARVPHLPVSLLRPLETLPPAINHRDRARPYETFERWGIATLGDLAALPADELASRLGRRGIALQRLARGLDPRPFVPDAETPRYIGRLELEWPIDALEPLSFVLARLLDPLSAALERADRGAAAIHLELRLTDRSTHTRLLQLPAAMRDPRVLRTLLLLDLESPTSPLRGLGETSAVTVAVDVVAIELDPAPARITQFSLLQRALPAPETLSTLTARLSALVGETRVGSPVQVDTHAPDAFEMTRYAPERPPSSPRGLGETGLPVHERRPGLRRQRPPLALRVAVEHGRPVQIASSRRGVPYGAIAQAAGPWRSSGCWWNVVPDQPSPGLRRSGAWSRDEWDVALKSGAVCRIYQDRTTHVWFLDGVYD